MGFRCGHSVGRCICCGIIDGTATAAVEASEVHFDVRRCEGVACLAVYQRALVERVIDDVRGRPGVGDVIEWEGDFDLAIRLPDGANITVSLDHGPCVQRLEWPVVRAGNEGVVGLVALRQDEAHLHVRQRRQWGCSSVAAHIVGHGDADAVTVIFTDSRRRRGGSVSARRWRWRSGRSHAMPALPAILEREDEARFGGDLHMHRVRRAIHGEVQLIRREMITRERGIDQA